MGRWSRLVAARFLTWLAVPPDLDWLEVGCGTGALTSCILAQARPQSIMACDRTPAFVTHARAALTDPRVTFVQADALHLPQRPGGYGAVVSGLVLNFLAEPLAGVRAMAAETTVPGVVAAYVWDYAAGMEFLRHFWDAAIHLDPDAAATDEGPRFPLCRPEALARLWTEAGLREPHTTALEIPTAFRSFEDYWAPLEGGQGPAPTYLLSLPTEHRRALQSLLRSRLPFGPDGTLTLQARAWAVKGTRPG
jgi:SAM-dependent methyltransferase